MRGILLVFICCACGLSVGCATGRENALKVPDMDDPQAYHDEWDTVRKEGRGAEATEKEWDSWTPKLMSPDEFAAFTASEKERWGRIIRQANIRLE